MDQDLCDAASRELIGAAGILVKWTAQSWRRAVRIVDAINTHAEKAVAGKVPFTGTDIDRGWLRGRDRDRTNSHRLRVIEDWLPGCATIQRPIDAALGGPDIGDARIRRMDGNGADAPAHRDIVGVEGLPIRQRRWTDRRPCGAAGGRVWST